MSHLPPQKGKMDRPKTIKRNLKKDERERISNADLNGLNRFFPSHQQIIIYTSPLIIQMPGINKRNWCGQWDRSYDPF